MMFHQLAWSAIRQGAQTVDHGHPRPLVENRQPYHAMPTASALPSVDQPNRASQPAASVLAAEAKRLQEAWDELALEKKRLQAERLELQRLTTQQEHWQRKQEKIQKPSPADDTPCCLDLLQHEEWLAELLQGADSFGDAQVQTTLSARLTLDSIWASIRPALPAPECGSGPYKLFFGLMFGNRDSRGTLELVSAQLFETAFVWKCEEDTKSVSPVGDAVAMVNKASALAKQLDIALDTFLASSFSAWADNHQTVEDDTAAAWIVCNDGDGFTLPAPLIRFVHAQVARQSWRATIVVLDVAKSQSTADGPAVEVFNLAESRPQRVLFDVV